MKDHLHLTHKDLSSPYLILLILRENNSEDLGWHCLSTHHAGRT